MKAKTIQKLVAGGCSIAVIGGAIHNIYRILHNPSASLLSMSVDSIFMITLTIVTLYLIYVINKK